MSDRPRIEPEMPAIMMDHTLDSQPLHRTAFDTEALPDTKRAPADQTYTVVKLDVGERFPDLADLMRSRRLPGLPVLEADDG